jgi:hypothetical protein
VCICFGEETVPEKRRNKSESVKRHVVLGFEPRDISWAFQVCTIPNKGLPDLEILHFASTSNILWQVDRWNDISSGL